MCSIIGYVGKDFAAPILVDGLQRMEYRGYDSVGVATKSDNGIELRKGVGRVHDVNTRLELTTMNGNVGIGHTRWATHGGITDVNAHPHLSNSKTITIVHNGIIENFEELKDILKNEGYHFTSDTDSEVIVNLLQKNYTKFRDVKKTILETVSKLKGHYSFVAMFEDGKLAAARFHKPLIIGLKDDNYFLTSDVLGFIKYTDDAIYLDNCNIAIINQNKLEILDFDDNVINYKPTKISKVADTDKGNFAHFTLKEIYEQPQTILKTGSNSENISKAASLIKQSKTYLTGSGTSYNAAFIGKLLLSKYAKVKAEHVLSSELPFLHDIIESDSTLIAISQSGESADVLEAVNIAKKYNCKIISIVNHVASSLARESDIVIDMNCGPEIGIAATKSFTSQIIILYKLLQELTRLDINFLDISDIVSKMLKEQSIIKKIADDLKDVSDMYILGRGIHYPIASESALKLKELAYIHAEGIAGGELKHGPLALIDSNVFVIIINPNDSTYTDTRISTMEIKARGAKIIGISDIKNEAYDYWIKLPKTWELEYVISEIIPIQLLSYYTALKKNTDPDHPRNLVKSVTVK